VSRFLTSARPLLCKPQCQTLSRPQVDENIEVVSVNVLPTRPSWSSSWQEAVAADDATKSVAEDVNGRPIRVRELSWDQPMQMKIGTPHEKRQTFQNSMFRCCGPCVPDCESSSVVDAGAALGEEESSAEVPCLSPRRRAQKTRCVHSDSDVPGAEPGKTALGKSDINAFTETKAEQQPIIKRILALSLSIPSMCKTSQLEALSIIQSVASQLLEQGQHEAAMPLGTRLLEFREVCLGPQHIDTLRSTTLMCSILEGLGKLAEAEEFYQKALRGFEQNLGSDHTMTLECVSNVVCLLETQGKLAAAELMSTELLQSLDTVLGAEHPNSARCASNLGCLLENQCRWREAESLYRRAAQSFQDAWGPTNPETIGTIYRLACVLEAKGDFEGALSRFRLVLSCCETSLGKLHPDTLGSLYNLAALLESMDLDDEAEKLFRRELDGSVQLLGRGHTAVGSSVHNLVRFLEERGKWQEARNIESQFLTPEVAAQKQIALCPHSCCKSVFR